VSVGNWKTHLIVNCNQCDKPMGFHSEVNPCCNACKRGVGLMSVTVYAARWRSHQGQQYAESLVSWDALESKVFGQAYAPSRSEVTFTSYQRVQGDS